MAALTKDEAEKFIREHGSLAFLIEAGLFVPAEPPLVIEETPWDLFKEQFLSTNSGFVRDENRPDSALYCIKQAIAAAGLELIKSSDKLVAVADADVADAVFDSPNSLTREEARDAVKAILGHGYVIARRATTVKTP